MGAALGYAHIEAWARVKRRGSPLIKKLLFYKRLESGGINRAARGVVYIQLDDCTVNIGYGGHI